jgi:hypothetical protein
MTRRGRRLCRWGCTAIAVVSLGVLAASKFWVVVWARPIGTGELGILYLGAGVFKSARGWPSVAPSAHEWRLGRAEGWNWGWSGGNPAWRYGVLRGKSTWGGDRHFGFSLMYPVVIAVLPAVALWGMELRNRRRARAGVCRACGYDRSGLAGDKPCPECGASAAV